MSALSTLFSPDPNPVVIRFVRHSPGRRRTSDSTMYDVCCSSVAQSESVRTLFAKYRRKDNPVEKPPELANVNIHPLVGLLAHSV
jgi:hypothetical protein